MEIAKCVKVQFPRLMGFKVGIFRISPIEGKSNHALYIAVDASLPCHLRGNETVWVSNKNVIRISKTSF